MATTAERLQDQDRELYDEINKYIDELKGYAQGDYDFVVKYLKKQFETALGTDDKARAEFFKEVSNTLEKRIGRIPYDYELKTGREKEDIANFLKAKDEEDTEQRKQEIEFQAQQELASTKEQKVVKEGANERGMLDSGIEKRQSQEVATDRKVNVIDPQERKFAFQQALRDEDRRLGKISSERNLADIKTEARRGGEDEQSNLEYGTEKAKKTLEERLAEIERSRSQQMRSGLAVQTLGSVKSLGE